ncbi:MAG: hypothetical protein CNLJKLNK_01211 [Holosporales bacterium]
MRFFCFLICFSFLTAKDIKKDIETYLDLLPTIEAAIVQVNPNGDCMNGKIFIDRKKKKLKLIYPKINQTIVVTDDTLYLQEEKDGDVQSMNASYTPAGLLLQSRIRFGKDVFVKDFQHTEKDALITLTDAEDGGHGSMTMSFQIEPFIKLTGWIVVDMQGNTTQVAVENLKGGITFASHTFDKPREKK